MNYNPFTIEGKTILVTGSSSGIGRSVAIACSKMGAIVMLNGRNRQKLDETISLMTGNGHKVFAADLTDSDAVVRMVGEMPKLDGIVHCAGIGQRILCKQLREQNVDSVMGANFKGPLLLQQALLERKKLNTF